MGWMFEAGESAYCPQCGEALSIRTTEAGERPHCYDCDLTAYRNPIPMVRATVVDSDRALLIEMGEGPDAGSWVLAGGHFEVGESPRSAASRELYEETNLAVDPPDLTVIGTGTVDIEDGPFYVSFNFAAPLSSATGTVQAGSDAADARFWDRDELASDSPLLRASGVGQVIAAMDDLG